jgi:hypothetical protein
VSHLNCSTIIDSLVGVEETWLDEELRKLPLFLVLASGSRARNHDTENVPATLVSTSSDDVVALRLLRTNLPRELKNVHIRHILPVHPSAQDISATTKQYVVFIKGSFKGEARLLDKVEGDRVWVKLPNSIDVTEHSKYDFVLSRPLKLGKGKDKRK